VGVTNVGNASVGAGTTGTTGAVVPIGRTVTWIIDNAGLKNIVTVEAAFLTIGLGGLT